MKNSARSMEAKMFSASASNLWLTILIGVVSLSVNRQVMAIVPLAENIQAIVGPVQWDVASGGNGHYYEFVPETVNWFDAVTAAEQKTFKGTNGFLVTINSQAEQDFVISLVTNNSWAGGSDEENEGDWKWTTGPEAGTSFWQSRIGEITYSNWSSGNPNNDNGIGDFLMINWPNATSNQWNDAESTGPYSYVVEFVPEPSSVMIASLGMLGILAYVWRYSSESSSICTGAKFGIHDESP